jgi:arginyl-tRNA synthetase
MITLSDILQPYLEKATLELFDVQTTQFEFQATRREFEGDISLVIFPLLKQIKGNPVEIGNKIGDYLLQNVPMVSKYNVVKGFLNLLMDDAYYLDFFNEIYPKPQFGFVAAEAHSKTMMVEFASPNTNKPLHLGHIRNILLGFLY